MYMKNFLNDSLHRINQWITGPDRLRISLLFGVMILIGGVFVGSIITAYTYGYSILTNFVSDLGTSLYTPVPFLFDASMMIGAILFVPAAVYLGNQVSYLSKRLKNQKGFSRWQLYLSATGFVGICLAFVGIFGVGLFPETYEPHLHLHDFSALFLFDGLIIAGISYGLWAILYGTSIPKSLGLYMIIVPLVLDIIYATRPLSMKPFFEWITLLSILAWILPTFFFLFRKMKIPTPT